MQENIIIQFAPAVEAGSRDALITQLHAEAALRSAAFDITVSDDISVEHGAVTLNCEVFIEAATPDGARSFNQHDEFVIATQSIDPYDLVTNYLHRRREFLATASRNILQGLDQLATDLAEGTLVPAVSGTSVDPMAYLKHTLDTILGAIPVIA